MIKIIGGGIGGSALSVKARADDLMRIRDVTAQVIAQHTHMSLEEVFELTAKDTYFEAEEAVAAGLADRIAELGDRSGFSTQQVSKDYQTMLRALVQANMEKYIEAKAEALVQRLYEYYRADPDRLPEFYKGMLETARDLNGKHDSGAGAGIGGLHS